MLSTKRPVRLGVRTNERLWAVDLGQLDFEDVMVRRAHRRDARVEGYGSLIGSLRPKAARQATGRPLTAHVPSGTVGPLARMRKRP